MSSLIRFSSPVQLALRESSSRLVRHSGLPGFTSRNLAGDPVAYFDASVFWA